MRAQGYTLDHPDNAGHEISVKTHKTYEAIVTWGCQEIKVPKGFDLLSNLGSLAPYPDAWLCVRPTSGTVYYARLEGGRLHGMDGSPSDSAYTCDWEDFQAAYEAAQTLDNEEGKG